MSPILEQFLAVFEAVAQIGLVVLFTSLLVRQNIIPKSGIKLISDTVITVFLPCMIFSNIVGRLQPSEFLYWWALPLSATLITLSGWAIAVPLFSRMGPEKRELKPVAFLQNAGYFVLPIGQLMLGETFDQFALYVFLYILANNPLLWLIGKCFLRKRKRDEAFQWSHILSPPIYANIVALFLVATGTRDYLPEVILTTATFLGQGAVPLGIFVLGATLGTLNIDLRRYLKPGSLVVLQKLFIMPAIVLGAMALVPWMRSDPLLVLLFILQGASPPATSLILQSQSYSDDSERVGTITIICYLVCMVSIPLWVVLANALFAVP
ncbi:MAG: AEC family transporter [Opitutales bacterium]|nr:AEC family transporter [Opitutales bacterium]